ncbi:hypothetical protein [Streptomyces vilmorinianum]|uniref:MmyB family transcriptional regulator n=1 Tax=Streptomyces vilmorinianum TaxID=3051092 RepID=UPI0010FB6710|nr:hypothetical protein [Streptomyces vilmorinianum]
MIVDRYAELVDRNDAFLALTATVAPALLAPPVNVARLLLRPRGPAPRIVNIDEWAWHIRDRPTEESVQNPDNRLTELLAELGAASASFAEA